MPNTHSADESGDRFFIEDITNHTVRLALVEATFRPTGDDPASVLASMLEKSQSFAYFLGCIDVRVVQEKTETPAHWNPGFN